MLPGASGIERIPVSNQRRQADPRRLRVLMVTPRYAPLVGGVETHTAEVAKRLRAAGHRVEVLTSDASRALPARELVDGVPVRRVAAWPRERDFYVAPGIDRAIQRSRQAWDIVHVQSYHTAVAPLAMLAALRAGIPYVVTFHSGGHSSEARNRARPVQWRVLRPLLGRAARLIAVARFEAEQFASELALPAERFVVVPNGSQVLAAVDAAPVAAEPALILSVGRLERYKGHQRAIAALPAVLAHCPAARLVVVGAGPYEPELRRQIDALGLAGRVEITSVPAGDRAGMARLLRRGALVVLFSDYEAHPIAVMEALALRRPVLATHTSGLGELAERELIRSIPLASADDPAATATAILASLRDPLLPAETHWPTWQECADGVLAVYRDVLDAEAAR